MGLELHGLNLLRYAGNLGDTITLGRCSNLLTAGQLGRAGLPRHFAKDKFADDLLLHLGARSVESYDYSGFEGATHLADFNEPLPPHRQYDTVIDFGTIEHVHDIAQALRNMRDLCRDGGQILHCSPSNNFCGHGFWQISPELFFSVYSEANGFIQTEVFMGKDRSYAHWFRVSPPVDGQRAQVSSSVPLFTICRTVKSRSFNAVDIQQSDYVSRWKGSGARYPGILGWAKDAIRENPTLLRLSLPIYQRFIADLSNRNPHLTKTSVRKLIAGKERNTAALNCQQI